MTLADLGVIVAGVALVLAMPSPATGWPLFLGPPPLLVLLVLGGLRLMMWSGFVLALVVLCRARACGGPIRPAERLALLLASLAVLELVPNLDEAVNVYYRAVGSASLDFGVARWLLSAPAAAGVALIVACLVPLWPRARDGSPLASALTVIGIVSGLILWFWGPCEVARLELPYLVVPGPGGDPRSWGWRAPVVFVLRDAVASGPTAFTWGLAVAVTVRTWRVERYRQPAWIWTELPASASTLAAALLLTVIGLPAPINLLWRASFLAFVGLVSWWVTGRLGIGRETTDRYSSAPVGTDLTVQQGERGDTSGSDQPA